MNTRLRVTTVFLSLLIATALGTPMLKYRVILSLRRLGLAFGATALLNVANAVETWHTSTVRNLYPMSNGSFVILLDSDSGSCTNANSPKKYYYVVVGENGVTNDGIKALLATSLAAAAQGKTVTVFFDTATAFCYVNRLMVNF